LSDFPEHWILTTFESICDSGQYGWTTRATDRGIVRFLRTTDITKGQIDWDSVPYCQDVPSSLDKYLLKVNDILISRAGSVGFSTLIGNVPFSTVFASYLIRFIPSEGIEARYVAYFLKSPEYWQQVAEASSGMALSNINAKKISEISIPLAPFNEQKRIADRLDVLIAQIEVCRDRLNRIPLILKRFRQSVLLLAMSGELTADWRKVFNESVEWRNVMLSEICTSIVDGTHQAPPQTESGIPFITISAINDGRLRIDKATRFVSSLYFEQLQPSRKPVIGDILFSVTGSIAIPALVDINEPFIFQRHIAILKPNSSHVISKFLFYVLNSENIKIQSQDVATGTAQKTISISRLRAFQIDLPCIDEQIEIVRRIEYLFAYMDLIEERYKKAYIQVEQLIPTLLNMAFHGELVPQDPADEPASVLLERIRIAKAAQPIKPRVSTTRRSTMTKLSQESVKEVIHQLSNDKFSFDELRGKIPGDYDLLKDILFTLLDEEQPILKQVFDREANAMCFVRGIK
jgi:type I restriction enzyme, S subunit